MTTVLTPRVVLERLITIEVHANESKHNIEDKYVKIGNSYIKQAYLIQK